MSDRGWLRPWLEIATVAALIFALPAPAAAQLNGQNIKGDAGLKAGSQAPPGGYVVGPLYWYSADAVKNRDGVRAKTSEFLKALSYRPITGREHRRRRQVETSSCFPVRLREPLPKR